MTPSEFKAWFDGFTEALDGVPSKDQWSRIKARVAEIDGRPVTERVYVDRYGPRRYYDLQPYWSSGRDPQCDPHWTAQAQAYQAAVANNSDTFDSHRAMLVLGRADAASIS
jgi:hypothetical protein